MPLVCLEICMLVTYIPVEDIYFNSLNRDRSILAVLVF